MSSEVTPFLLFLRAAFTGGRFSAGGAAPGVAGGALRTRPPLLLGGVLVRHRYSAMTLGRTGRFQAAGFFFSDSHLRHLLLLKAPG